MNLTSRIFLAYFAILAVAIFLILSVFMSEIKHGVRQSTEDTLVDMSNLLAEVLKDDLVEQRLQTSEFKNQVALFLQRSYRAKIFQVDKVSSAMRIYITDAQGIVQFDSADYGLGKDYSQWNDVYLTLRGKYGARSSPTSKSESDTSVMHVAAAIVDQGEIIGSITVAKANLSLQPFIDMAQQKIEQRGILLILFSLLTALIFAYWLTASIRKLAKYADNVAAAKPVVVPHLGEPELRKLANSIENMRHKLAGKEYVDKYIHALTHELKSPVSAIKGAAEIISDDMPVADRARFVANIRREVERINVMINKMLALAKLEKCEMLSQREEADLAQIIAQVLASKALQLDKKSIAVKWDIKENVMVLVDPFLLTQALDNLLQNALDFSAFSSEIHIQVTIKSAIEIEIKDWGQGIPAYALNKIFERFYSLPRSDGAAKSSGLGLCFVQQICLLHQGSIKLENHSEGGVTALLTLPH